ncbi:MAG: hypothetical protein ABR589_11870 [Chthoniobacterales bacterium]
MTAGLKWRIAIGLVLVFGAGVATGMFVGVRQVRHKFIFRHGEMVGDHLREHLKRQLDLTPDQMRQVEPILEQTTERLRAIRTETTRRVAETMEESHRQLLPHLNTEQQAQMEKMKRRHLRILHRRKRYEPPPPEE